MGSLQNLSVIRGPTRAFKEISLDKIFEGVAGGTAADNIALIFEGNQRAYIPVIIFLNNVRFINAKIFNFRKVTSFATDLQKMVEPNVILIQNSTQSPTKQQK